MSLPNTNYIGPPIEDEGLFERLPIALQDFMNKNNGVIAFGGGLHIRGLCSDPKWHSLRHFWEGPDALHRYYRSLTEDDIPFGEDCIGYQFLLRNDSVHRLNTEVDKLTNLHLSFEDFLSAAISKSDEVLHEKPLYEFEKAGGILRPGQLLNIYPPYCSEEAQKGVAIMEIPTLRRLTFLKNLASQVRDLPPGTHVDIQPF